MVSRWLAALLSGLSVASADLIFSMDQVQDWEKGYGMQLQLTAPEGAVLPLNYGVLPLTRNAGLNQTDRAREVINIKGNLVWATTTNYNNITNPDAVAYLSCDNNSNSSNISPSDMLTELMSQTPELKAILLYSTEGNCCGLGEDDPVFKSIFTMTDAREAADTLRQTNSAADGIVRAVITGNSTTVDQDNQDSQGGNNSAIAMSILYSITGVITLLFLVIIATGAIRAHRYPERYGPRSGYGGRPRQSRAKGLARAVLETIPIVKFGAPAPAKEDPALELESQPSVTAHDPNMGTRLSAIPEEPQRSPVKDKETTAPTTDMPAESTEAEPGTENRTSKGEDEYLGCSICTEDFTVGEDVRVLPCDHKYHPNCIDPWLINVSGTCPLCRLDLRPRNGSVDGSGDANAQDDMMQLPPPLETEGGETEQPNAQRSARRTSRLLDLNRLRHASVEERIEILRRHRSQQRQESGPSDGSETAERHSHTRLSDRLREKFRIHTKTQHPERENQGPR